MREESTHCINCDKKLEGKFCHGCGQKTITAEDKKLKHFFIEFLSSLFFADGKLLSTFKALFFQPGKLGKAYIDGVRKKFLSPLQVFFFANLLYFLIPHYSTFDTHLTTQMNSFFYSSTVKRVVADHISTSKTDYGSFETHYERNSTNNAKLLLIVLVLMQAFILQILFIRKKQFYFLDHIGISAYLNGFIILAFFVILSSLTALLKIIFDINLSQFLDETIMASVIIFSIFCYSFFLLKGSFEIGVLKSFFYSTIIAVLFFQLVIFYRFFLFWITFWQIS